MRTLGVFVPVLLLLCTPLRAAERFETRAEATDYRETPRYDETIAYLRALEAESRWVRLAQYGTTPLGRPMYCVIVSSERTFTPQSVRHEGKLVLLVQNGIHAGEIAGKDACLALIRDLAVTRTRAELLEHVVLIVIPVFNIDGHELVSPYNRINQNGPAEMGFRTTAHNYNLNRDYLKADAPEMRALVALWNDWQPDLYIDNHVTDGADFRYTVTYTATRHDNAAPSVRDWSRQVFIPGITAKMEAAGEPIVPYVITRGKPVDSGIIDWVESPRFSTGYAAIRNRPGLLVELHMLKTYERRVKANYELMAAVLEVLNEKPAALRDAVHLADSLAARGLRDPLPLTFRRLKEADTITFLGYKSEIRQSAVSGGSWVHYDTTEPQTMRIPYWGRMEPDVVVTPPHAYLIPPQWTDVAERLALHDVELKRLSEPVTLSVENYRLDSVQWKEESYEGHHPVDFSARAETTLVTYPARTVVVFTAQPGVRLIVHALEPGGPDSFLRWGFFDTILEQKEYADRHVAEALAVKMLAEDPALRTEFEALLAADSAFAASPQARWGFFYKRSPWAEPMLNVYPVARLVAPQELPLTGY